MNETLPEEPITESPANEGPVSRSETLYISVSDRTREVAKKVIPTTGNISKLTDAVGIENTINIHDYERHIATAQEVTDDKITDLYIQFGGAGATAESQAPLMKEVCRPQSNKNNTGMDVKAISIESAANPEAKGPISPIALERSLVDVELIISELEKLPNAKRVFLSFRSMSGLEAVQTTLILQTLLNARNTGQIAPTPEIAGLFLFQAGQVTRKSLSEFSSGVIEMSKKSREKSQLFPDIEDFWRVRDAIDLAREKQDVGSERRNLELLEQMKRLNPNLEILMLTDLLNFLEQDLRKAPDNKFLEEKIKDIRGRIGELETSNATSLTFGEGGENIKSTVQQIDEKMWRMHPPKNKQERAQYNKLRKQRQDALKPIITQHLTGKTDIPNTEVSEPNKASELIRLATTLMPHLNIIRKMPYGLHDKLIEANIPVSYIVGDRDSVFPADKLLSDLRLTPNSLEQIVILFGNHPHSTLNPVNAQVASVIRDLMERSTQLKDGQFTQNPGRKLIYNTQV